MQRLTRHVSVIRITNRRRNVCVYSSDWLHLFASETHTIWHKYSRTTEAGCQTGTNTYQCWLPLQLKWYIAVTQMHKKHKKKKIVPVRSGGRMCQGRMVCSIGGASGDGVWRGERSWCVRAGRREGRTTKQKRTYTVVRKPSRVVHGLGWPVGWVHYSKSTKILKGLC